MSGINAGRVLLGGLLAGLVINIGETILNVAIVGPQWEEAMRALGIEPAAGPALAFYFVYGFLIGIAAVWLYAAIRPRFGPGPRTAAVAGLFVWFVSYFLFAVMEQAQPMFPQSLIWIGTAWGLVEVPLATMAGAWVYREGTEARASTAEAAPA